MPPKKVTNLYKYKANKPGKAVLAKTKQPQKNREVIAKGTTAEVLKTSNDKFVVRRPYRPEPFNRDLHRKLRALDINEQRYARYHRKPGSDEIFVKKLNPLQDEKKLTKAQYRHLRDSVQNLHGAGVSHGDLPGNVMLDPETHLPIIMDWGTATTNATPQAKEIDYNAFFRHFKVAK